MKLRIYTKKSEQEKRRYLRNNMTKTETLLWKRLQRKKTGVRFLRQYSIGKFVVDFYAPSIKLAIEADGVTHISPEEIEYDQIRQSIIAEHKITFLRFTNLEIYDDIENVEQKIRDKIAELSRKSAKAEPPTKCIVRLE